MTWLARSVGFIGAVAFALAWIPQSIETIKAGRCDVNGKFLALAALGSASLMGYALMQGDAIFSFINALTTLGAAINLYFKID